MSTSEPVAITVGGHRTRLKWHRARKQAADAPFTTSRIVEGMRVGASVEVDLLIHGATAGHPRGFTVLHDRTLDAATTGVGTVRAASATYLRSLHLRDNDGHPVPAPVLLLDDLSTHLTDIHPDALLQLDFKQSAADLDDAVVTAFADAVESFAPQAILSCGDADAVRILTDAVPRIRVGYDPCHHGAVDRVLRWRRYRHFVESAVAASPRADTIYLDKRLVLTAADRGVDLIDQFHTAARQVDIYTFTHEDDPGIVRALVLHPDQLTTDDPVGVADRFRAPTT